MNLARLRDFTTARVALGRAGDSLPTRELLDFQLAHARARDAVHAELDAPSIALELKRSGRDCLIVHGAAADRATYLRRPDLGRRLNAESRASVAGHQGAYDAVFVVAGGLSALAIHRHAVPLLETVLPKLDPKEWRLAPVAIVQQGRVAIGDEIGELVRASLAIVLIGERPGLSAPDSLGIYLTWRPRIGLTDADRNCISNIRAEGLSYASGAQKLLFLMTESRRRKLSGVQLKEDDCGRLLGVGSIDMDIDPELAARAMEEGLKKYPRFAVYGPKLIARALFQGHALMLEYAEPPPREDPDAWEFQNAVVKTYKKLGSSL